MSFNFFYFRLILKGSSIELARFWREFEGSGFSLNRICPVPSELDFENTNLVKTGFLALFGDWVGVSRQWMLKDVAIKNGYPFPLQTREQVVECLREIDEENVYLLPAIKFHSNLEKFGFGSREDWRKKYWGISDEVNVSLFEMHSDFIELRFASSAFPRMAMKKLSNSFPEISFEIDFNSDTGMRKGAFRLKAGREEKC